MHLLGTLRINRLTYPRSGWLPVENTLISQQILHTMDWGNLERINTFMLTIDSAPCQRIGFLHHFANHTNVTGLKLLILMRKLAPSSFLKKPILDADVTTIYSKA